MLRCWPNGGLPRGELTGRKILHRSDAPRCGGYGMAMERDKRKIEKSGDGRPVEEREGQEPKADDKAEEDIPDPSTVENIGY